MGAVSTYKTYRQVVDDPRCQEILKWAAAEADTQMSGEEFLASAAKVVAIPLPLGAIGAIGAGLSRGYAALGVRTGKTQTHIVDDQPYGYVLLAVLAFLAASAMPIVDVADNNDQALIQAILPSNPLSWKGRIIVALRADGQRVHVEAVTKIPGQLYDWGRSKRTLAKLFQAVEARASLFRERDL
jgi:hypothetical protein